MFFLPLWALSSHQLPSPIDSTSSISLVFVSSWHSEALISLYHVYRTLKVLWSLGVPPADLAMFDILPTDKHLSLAALRDQHDCSAGLS